MAEARIMEPAGFLECFKDMARIYVAMVLICAGLIMGRISLVSTEPSPMFLALGIGAN
jgi:hypothetical protein